MEWIEIVYDKPPMKIGKLSVGGYSFVNKPVTDSLYCCKMNNRTEYVCDNSFVPKLTEDRYCVYVRYGPWVRIEPRIVRSNLYNDTIDNNETYPLLSTVIIESNGRLSDEELAKDPNYDIVKKMTLAPDIDLPLISDIKHYLVRHYNKQNKREKAIEVSKRNVISHGKLYLHDTICQEVFEISAAYYYNGDKEESHFYQDKAFLSPVIPKETAKRYLTNIYLYYLGAPLDFVRHKYWNISCLAHYTPMNAGIIKVDNPIKCDFSYIENSSYYLTIRTVNYFHTHTYISNDDDKHIRTVTYLATMDNNLNVTSSRRIINRCDYIHHRHYMVECIEDMRLFKFNNKLYIVGTGIDTHHQQSHQIVIGQLQLEEHVAYITKMYTLEYAQWRCQKNWLPFPEYRDGLQDHELAIIYKYEPFTLLKVNMNNGICTLYKEVQQKINCSSFRGSAVPFRHNGKWLMLVHNSQWFSGKNTYVQRMVEFDDNLQFTRVSCYFQTSDHHMEYIMGFQYDEEHNEFLFTTSKNDAHGGISTITYDQFQSMMYTL